MHFCNRVIMGIFDMRQIRTFCKYKFWQDQIVLLLNMCFLCVILVENAV